MDNKDHRSVTASHDELCDGALEHYKRLSTECSDWSSMIPRAIAFYRKYGAAKLSNGEIVAVGNFDILKKMGDSGMDIKLAPLSNIVELKKLGKNGEVTIGVDHNTIVALLSGKEYVGGLLLADKAEFESVEASFGDSAES